MQPIWEYINNMKSNKTVRKQLLMQDNGKPTQNDNEIMKNWEEWIKQDCDKHDQHHPELRHITEEQWGTWGKQILKKKIQTDETTPKSDRNKKKPRL